MYGHLTTIAQNHGSVVILLIDQTIKKAVYPPGFAQSFNCLTIGIITKSDLNQENEGFCTDQLKKTGVPEPYYKMSLKNEFEINKLKDNLLKKIERMLK